MVNKTEMKLKPNLKSFAFLFFILFCAYESITHFAELLLLRQPTKKNILQDRLILSPKSLVYDRQKGFLQKMSFKIYLENGNVKGIQISEEINLIGSYIERIIIRHMFISSASNKSRNAIFCDRDSPLLKIFHIKDRITKVEVNHLSLSPNHFTVHCK